MQTSITYLHKCERTDLIITAHSEPPVLFICFYKQIDRRERHELHESLSMISLSP
jgi:hypothetical protein